MSTRQKTIIGALALIIVVGLVAYFTMGTTTEEDTDTQRTDEASRTNAGLTGEQTVAPDGLGVRFSYTAGEDGLRLIEPNIAEYGEPTMLDSFVIMEEQAYTAIERGETPSQGPSVVTLFVFDAGDQSDPEAWARAFGAYTNIEAATSEPETRTLGNMDALYYTTMGLYTSEVYIVNHDGKMYLLTGNFASAGGTLNTFFTTLVESIEFTS